MNKAIIYIALLIILNNCQTVTITTICACTQRFTESDCGKRTGCTWDKTKKSCNITEISTTPTDTTIYAAYCDQFNSADECPKKKFCAWDGKACTHFTACTPFVYDDDAKCQAVSTRCITDGVSCVEKAECSTYLSQKSCVVNNLERYCYWNTTNAANPKCEDADDCPKLPITLASDAVCREQISKCTAKEGGGCVELGAKCEDQVAEIGCVQDKSGVACFWSKGKCLDKTCDNASNELVTDQSCKNFIKTCTTKQEGGCVTRSTCGEAIQAACMTNNLGEDCFWNGTVCVDKTCANALSTNQTNASCQSYLKKCITTGNGCTDNTGCGAAKFKDACDKTLTGDICHWDGATCKIKICENAGSSYVGHDQCTTYMATCTAKSGSLSGCQDRICTNAPKSNVTNDQCEAYLPKQNCVTQDGGGCRINTTCEAINIEVACRTDIKGKVCFWVNQKCLTRICTNAPSSNNSHTLCNDFLSTCTFGSGQTCVEKTCENVQEEENCDSDYNNKPCIYKEKCYQKQCALASKNYTAYSQCKDYLTTCTLDNSGSGCMDVPIKCEAITQKEGCQIKKGGGKCGWNGKSCVDQSCLTAPSDKTTSALCNNYRSGCVVDNDGAGCIDLPATCSARKLKDNCEIEETGKCQWDYLTNPVSPVCIDVKCENAHLVTLKPTVTQSGCWSYFNLKCVINIAGDKCIPRPQACSGLAETACKQAGVILISDTSTQDCYWDAKSGTCRDKACANITLDTYTHVNCKRAISTCTVNAALTKCQDIVACDKYTDADQCQEDTNGNVCVWSGTCKDKSCLDAEDSTSFDTDAECQTFSTKCTLTQKKCALKQATCAAIKNEVACAAQTIGRKQCAWNTGTSQCSDATFDCTKATGTGFTLGYCQYLSTTCSVKQDGTACIPSSEECLDLSQENCVWSRDDKYCYWDGEKCTYIGTSTQCSDIAGNSAAICKSKKSVCTWFSGNRCAINCAAFTGPFNFDTCYQFDPKCTIKTDGTGCALIVATCAETSPANCTYAEEGTCRMNDTSCILASSEPFNYEQCYSITGKVLSPFYCMEISNYDCSANSEMTGCVASSVYCEEYISLNDCFSGLDVAEQLCILDADNYCITYDNNCAHVKLLKEDETPITYTEGICNYYGCQAKADGSGCEIFPDVVDPHPDPDPTCGSYTGILTYEACIGFLNSCSVNANKTSCVTAQDTCSAYTVADCGYAINEGECIVSGTICVQKNCDSAASNTLSGCQAVSPNCVVRAGGCQFRNDCALYTVSGACKKSSTGTDCLWNPTSSKCVDKSCSAAEASPSFNTHVKCFALGKCTVKATATKQIGQGCIEFAACNQYTIQEQCKTNTKGELCDWNTNTDPAICADKSCATASNDSYNTHAGCQGYLLGCTVNVVDDNGTLKPYGCVALKTCNLYNLEEQCQFSIDKDDKGVHIQCGWNGSVCANRSCLTAQETVNTQTLCNDYFPGCTVNATNNGCVVIPDICIGMTENQCYEGSTDKFSRKCFWDTTENKCITKKCENSPKFESESDCQNFLPGCTTDTIKCKTKICEDFPFSTDALCQAALSTCTSNGENCVKRGICSQALTEVGCVTDSNNRPCQWMAPSGQTAYCINKTCTTAPSNLATEAQCVSYFTPAVGTCTTKKDGGCTVKEACTTANVAAACTTDSGGNDCQWDTETSRCRLKECQDFIATSHVACYKLSTECTIGQNGRCAKMTNCQDIKVRAACIEGYDGPCLWIAKYDNGDFTLGACFSYESCKSLKWSSNEDCKLISPNCTTDGTQCVGITSCASTNIRGGCKTGTDGLCIQTVSAKGATNTICKKFTSCSDAYFLTHEECNLANQNCTSNYSTGCIPLAACSQYAQNSCYINKDGAKRNANGGITSTGVCVWDDTTKLCQDQQCSDLTFTTEYECASRLNKCTSDGVKCLIKGSCSSYTTQSACNVAGSIVGACFWVAADASGYCRNKVCSDIPNGITTQACQGIANCVSNGTDCIVKVNCFAYTTKTACNSKGSDGICVWTETTAGGTTTGKCFLMTSCASAGTDGNACTQANDRCQMDSKTKVCADHTCYTYAAQFSICKYFYTWDQKKYNICQLFNGACIATNADLLKEEDCNTLTAYLYSWNPISSKCTQCATVVVQPNNTDNNTSIGNQANTDSGYILGMTSIMVALLMSSLF